MSTVNLNYGISKIKRSIQYLSISEANKRLMLMSDSRFELIRREETANLHS